MKLYLKGLILLKSYSLKGPAKILELNEEWKIKLN